MNRIALTAVILFAAFAACGGNRILNGSFEHRTNADGLPDGWGNGQWGIKFGDEIPQADAVRAYFGADTTLAAEGTTSFRIANRAGERQQMLYSSWIKFPAFLAAPEGWYLAAYLQSEPASNVTLAIVNAGNEVIHAETFAVGSEFRRFATAIPKAKLQQSPVAIRISTESGTVVRVDAVQLDRGTQPHDWEPSKFDATRCGSPVPARPWRSSAPPPEPLAPATRVEISDRKLLRDGQPFYPCAVNLGWTGDPDSMRAVRDAGFNAVVIDASDVQTTRAALDAAAAVGLAAIPWLTGSDDAALATVKALNRHPALLFWQGTDEPVHPLADVVVTRIRKLQEADPCHPVMVNYLSSSIQEHRNDLQQLPGAILSSDIYPVANTQWPGTLLDPADTLATMERNLVATPKIPMFYLQLTGNAFMNDREPTPEEFEAMSYATVVAGARGIFLFQNVPWSPRLFAAAGGMAREWHALAPFLAESPRHDGIACTDPTLVWSLRQANGQTLLVAVNPTPQPVKATFTGAIPATREVVFENRNISGNGDLTDDFAPYQRHLYRWPTP